MHLTDLHLHADPDFELMGINTHQSLLQVLEHVRTQAQRPERVLITGDLTHDETQEGYRQLRPILESLALPVHVLPGNHDIPALMQQELNTQWINTAPLVLLDHWQIIMLDTSTPGQAGGMLNEIQLKHLQDCLEQHPSLNSLVCMHHSPLAIDSAWLDTMRLSNHEHFINLLLQYPRVKAVIWGHVHQDFHQQHEHIQFMSTPASCGQFLPGANQFAIDEHNGPGYRWLYLGHDGELSTTVTRLPSSRKQFLDEQPA